MVSLKVSYLKSLDKKELQKLLHDNNSFYCNQLLKKSIKYTDKAIDCVLLSDKMKYLKKVNDINKLLKHY